MASDTSLVFNLIAKDKATAVLGQMKEKIATAAAGISAAAAGALSKGIADSLDMGAASDKLAAQLGVGAERAGELAKVSANVYKQAWGESTAEVNDAIKGVIQNIGGDAASKGLEKITTKALALAKTFDVEVSESTAAAGQLIRTGLVKDADEAFDVITKGFQAGVDKAGDFTDTLTEYSTQFRQLGLDGATATGLLAQGLRAGARDADVVADSLKEFTLIAQSGSKASVDAFKDLGLNAKVMQQAFIQGGPGAANALDQVLDRLRAVKNPVDQSSIALALFGTKAEDMQRALYALDPSTAKKGLGEVAGAADQMAKTVGDNPAAALEKFKREATVKLAEVGGQIVQFGQTHSTWLQPIAIVLGVIAGAILLVQGATMTWTAAQGLWTGVQGVATAAQWAWNAALSASPVTWMIIAVVALVAAVVLLWQHSETFRDIVTSCWQTVWAGISWVWNWIASNWPLLLGILTGPIGWAVLGIVRHWDAIKSGAGAAFDFVAALPGRIATGFQSLGEILVAPFRWGFNQIASLWNRTAGRLSFTLPDWVPGVGGRGFSMPHIPMLAQGGHITGSGTVLVGEAGPELLDLPGGATVTPLSRAGAGPTEIRIVLDTTGADSDMQRLMRRLVRVTGQGSAQAAFT
ncbi:phage tail tape measure protein [Streptomyces rubellomurinus]|uniref:phage tail tape measure protein n=1 Tax=Streptomyces rubellomurinus (strain ATCC 31215) TaxID=359131 RepID=UPI0006969BE4|nr:phage tail tape measure protein [Streptomyces rubellomurinus]